MDGRGRIAQSLNWIARLRARPPTGGAARPRVAARRVGKIVGHVRTAWARRAHDFTHAAHSDVRAFARPTNSLRSPRLQAVQRFWVKLLRIKIPRGAGV